MTLNVNLTQNTPPTEKFVLDITSVAWHEVSPKMRNSELRKALKALNIVNYTSEIKEVYFTFMVLPADVETWRDSKSSYSPQKKKLSLIAWLDYKKFAQASDKEAITMQAQTYLDTILTFPTIRGLKKNPFDHQKFYNDVKALFEKNQWIPTTISS